MYPTTNTVFDDSVLILDEEFDSSYNLLSVNQQPSSPLTNSDYAWDDQLDNGEEMSL